MGSMAHLPIAALALLPASVESAEPPDSGSAGIEVVRVNRQRSFGSSVPAGNYSGVAWLGGSRYAVVSDKSAGDGFYVFDIDIDSVSGKVRGVRNKGFRASGTPNRDQEGIAYEPRRGRVYVSGEKDNRVLEYDSAGLLTGRQLALPEVYATAGSRYGIEALTYNASTRRFWLSTESTLPCDGRQAGYEAPVRNRLRLQCSTTV